MPDAAVTGSMPQKSKRWIRMAALAVAVMAGVGSLWFGMRSARTFILLQSAYEVGVPEVSLVRGWMTLRYVATSYRIPEPRLLGKLGLPAGTALDTSLRALAERKGVSPFQYVQEVQAAVASAAPPARSSTNEREQGWLNWINDHVLSAVLRYGYAALAMTLLLSAIGLPLPAGLVAVIAGSQASAGRMDWLAAGAIAVAASVAGDVIDYWIGRSVSETFLARRGRWLGYTPARHARAKLLFERWGALTVLLTRTLAANLSTIVSLFAGLGHYRISAFVLVALTGRVLWTAAYVGLGFAIGGSLEAAADFLKNLSGLVVSVPLLVAAALIAAGRIRIGRPSRSV